VPHPEFRYKPLPSLVTLVTLHHALRRNVKPEQNRTEQNRTEQNIAARMDPVHSLPPKPSNLGLEPSRQDSSSGSARLWEIKNGGESDD